VVSGFIENKIPEYNLNPNFLKRVARFFKKRKGSFNSWKKNLGEKTGRYFIKMGRNIFTGSIK
jgi:hypothetical protein